MGETDEEINEAFEDLRLHEVDIVTLEQYLDNFKSFTN